MIPKSIIDSYLNILIKRITGIDICNPALFREELGDACPSDEAILAENDIYLAEEAAKIAHQNEINAGFDTGLGFRIGLDDDSQVWMTQTKVSAISLGYQNSTPIDIPDIDGNWHTITYGDLNGFQHDYIIACFNLKKSKPK